MIGTVRRGGWRTGWSRVVASAAALTAMLAAAPTARAQSEGADLLTKSRAAIKELESLSFKAKGWMQVQGAAAVSFGDRPMELEGEVMMLRADTEARGWMTRRQGVATMQGKPVEYMVIVDETITRWIEHENKTVKQLSSRSAKGPQISSSGQGWLPAIAEAEAYSKELTAPAITLEGSEDVNGEPCNVVLANMGENKEQIRWWISTNDHLPRRWKVTFGGGGFATDRVVEVSDLKTNPPMTPDLFAIVPPEGYKVVGVQQQLTPLVEVPATTTNTQSGETRVGDGARPRPPARQSPAFDMGTADGKRLTLADCKDRVTVLVFAGTWHPRWKPLAAEFQKLSDGFKDEPVSVYFVPLREKEEGAPAKFMKDNGLTFGVLTGGDKVAPEFGQTAFPHVFVIGKAGEIVHEAKSFANPEVKPPLDDLRAVIAEYLAGPPAAPRAPAAPTGDDGG